MCIRDRITPTLARLPGYPAFLAMVFKLFGVGNFRAVLLVQVLFDLATCFLIANLARRLFSGRSAQVAFLLAALCPFLANYAAAALTETLEIFFTVLALDLAFRGLGVGETASPTISRPLLGPRLVWVGCGLSVGGAILLRPDGGILLAAIGGYLLWLFVHSLRLSLIHISWSHTDVRDKNFSRFREALLTEVMPKVESEYRVAKGRDSRAIAGLSMGGAESLLTGLNNLDKFAWIGAFSSGGMPDEFEKDFPGLDAKASQQIRLLWIACGTEDRLLTVNRNLREWLKTKGVEHTDIEMPGMHTWMVWRRNLAEFAPLLFR